jgi:hypothetical protein
MDPNANLKEQMELSISIQKAYEDGNGVDQDDANRLAELVDALNAWICNGGFLPGKWERK